ncbi:MAG: hypothetical protein ACP5PT_01370 [Brevinematia bacterium]
MKNKFILVLVVILLSFSSIGFGLVKDFDIASTGGTGIIIYPSLDVSKSFEFGVGGNWVIAPRMVFSPALSIAFQNFNFGAAFDYSSYNDGWPKPLIFSAKYQIVAGLGIYGDLQWFIDPNNTAFSIMLLGGNGLFGLSVGGGWDLTFGFGLSFDPRFTWNLNTFFAIQKAILLDVLFLNLELANYSYRVFYDPFFSDNNRGIFNMGLNIVPAKWISISINGLDLLDWNRSLGISLNFRFNP